MKSRSIVLNIVLWAEIIVAARALMFTLPVLITKYSKGQIYNILLSDWVMFAVTIIAFFYFLTGIASVLQYKGWKVFHYVGLVLTVLLTVALVSKATTLGAAVSFGFFLPLLISAVLAFAVTSYRPQAASLTIGREKNEEAAHVKKSI